MNNVTFPVACVAILALAGCAAPSSPMSGTSASVPATTISSPSPELEPLSLDGKWKQSNSNAEDAWQAITIAKDTIEIYWISDGDTRSIYWIGSYVPPKTADDAYKWVSKRDKKKTDNAILASSDATKKFTYEDGVLSYEVSLMGTARTVKAERV